MEQQNQLEVAVNDAMRERLLKTDLTELAEEYAKLKTWEVFQPLISAVTPEYKVEIAWEE